jgi:predicted ATPase/class 3 adenylate cyclase/Tfp pilus assembly protein PilF
VLQASTEATLLFTDIEGSTHLWEVEGEKMAVALAAHDALSCFAVEQNRGSIIKMTGDGMYAAFADPRDAVGAAVMLQRSFRDPAATSGIPFRVRCGLHTGVVERRGADLFGAAVNRAARIMHAAHGGQILISDQVAKCVRDSLRGESSLRDLGKVRLRGFASAEHVFQLLHPDLPQDFPSLRGLEAPPHNLPQQATSFIGREREVAEAKRLLEHTRLLTLLGMGGLGKTRLSLQIASDILENYVDGVWFVDFSPIRDPSLVPNAVAQTLGLREEPGTSLIQTLCAYARQHELLIVLDNCEHLVDACAHLADALLRAAPDLRLIATSREALHISGEQTYLVLPLQVPASNAGLSSMLRSEAVQLFIERARLCQPAFEVVPHNATAVAELCGHLEGIPLALELAAARLRLLSIDEINARLKDRFKLLTGGSRAALERHQTLRALVRWSYDLLPENERIALERLSVFAGGFGIAAAEVVCGAEPLVVGEVFDLVGSLVEKSLITAEAIHGAESRYRMLETIREFAHSLLRGDKVTEDASSGACLRPVSGSRARYDDLARTAARHCDYFLSMAKTARNQMEGPDQGTWTRRLEAELDNLRAAIALSLAGGVDPILAVKFEVALMRFRILRGYASEARRNVRVALGLPPLQAPTAARAHAQYTAGVLATSQGDHSGAIQLLGECLTLRRTLGNLTEIAATLSTLAAVHLQEGDVAEAVACEEEALGIFRQVGERTGEGISLLHLGEIAMQAGDDEAAESRLERCLAIALDLKHQELEAECERNLGELLLAAGDLGNARVRFERSLRVCRNAADKRNEALALRWLGKSDTANGDYDQARARFAEALDAFKGYEMNVEALDCLDDHAELLAAMGCLEDAARLQAATTSIRGNLGLPRTKRAQAHRERRVNATSGNGPSESLAWSLEHAIDFARTCVGAQRPAGLYRHKSENAPNAAISSTTDPGSGTGTT